MTEFGNSHEKPEVVREKLKHYLGEARVPGADSLGTGNNDPSMVMPAIVEEALGEIEPVKRDDVELLDTVRGRLADLE